jgi:O-antigen/teichoic acid export membrane protein
MQNKLWGRVLGYVAPMIIMCFVIWSYILIRGKMPSMECAKYAVVVAVPLVFNALAGNVLATSDRIMIKQMVGAEETAIYTVPYTVASLMSIIWTALNQAWTPWLYDRLHEGNFTTVREKSKLYLGIYAIFIIPALLVTPEIILILAGRAYYEARYIMPPIIVGCVFQFVYGMYVNIETFEKKTWLIVKGTFGAAMINIVLNFIFIPKLGYLAAAYTTLVGYFFLMLFHSLSVKRLGNYEGIYDEKWIKFVVFGVFVLHFVFMVLYRYVVIRYILLALYLVLLFCMAYKTNLLSKLVHKKRS